MKVLWFLAFVAGCTPAAEAEEVPAVEWVGHVERYECSQHEEAEWFSLPPDSFAVELRSCRNGSCGTTTFTVDDGSSDPEGLKLPCGGGESVGQYFEIRYLAPA